MVDPYVKARCNLLAVLRGIEYLAEKDKECAALIKDTHLALQFNIKNGPSANLQFAQGKATMKEGRHPCSLKLFFTSPEHFNKMIDGNANPIPIKGFTKIKFLTGPFMKFADKLNYYLKPEGGESSESGAGAHGTGAKSNTAATSDLLKDPEYFKMNTELTAYTAFFALAEIGNYDTKGKLSAAHMPDGVLQVQVQGGIGVQVTVQGGHITTTKGVHPDPRAILGFKDLEAAHMVLNGQLDTFTGLGNGQMSMRGFIPMLDNMNPLLDLVPTYLS